MFLKNHKDKVLSGSSLVKGSSYSFFLEKYKESASEKDAGFENKWVV